MMQGDVGPQGEVEEEAELREAEGQRVRCKMAVTHTWGRPAAQTDSETHSKFTQPPLFPSQRTTFWRKSRKLEL